LSGLPIRVLTNFRIHLSGLHQGEGQFWGPKCPDWHQGSRPIFGGPHKDVLDIIGTANFVPGLLHAIRTSVVIFVFTFIQAPPRAKISAGFLLCAPALSDNQLHRLQAPFPPADIGSTFIYFYQPFKTHNREYCTISTGCSGFWKFLSPRRPKISLSVYGDFQNSPFFRL
jgi:hypothetical protein